MALKAVNPSTEEVLAEFDEASPAEVEHAIERAESGFREWRAVDYGRRREAMEKAARYLREQRTRFAALITAEMGKPIVEAEAEIDKCAWSCEFIAAAAEQWLASTDVESGGRRSYVSFQPLGPILAIMPWNFPFWQVFRFAAPSLMARNVALVKHAPNVPQCALAIEETFREAGFPKGVYGNCFIPIEHVPGVIRDARIRGVTLTGSVPTGAKVAAESGRAIKKTVLELGGSDPFVILDDANIEETARVAVRARNQNSGQSCIASKRFIVVDRVAEEFASHFSAGVAALQTGDPTMRETNIGPLARLDLRDHLVEQVDRSVALGARVLTGGHAKNGTGYFYEPTVLDDVRTEMPVYSEETFGPAAAVIHVRDEAEAVAVANDTPYGLGASIWTQDLDRAARLAGSIEAGSVFVNAIVASDPRLPFGGVKQSGFGRELSQFGLHEFVNIQSVWMRLPGDPVGPQPVSRTPN
jgi:succinate-semialdehyde dehydrogenase / glutarate-semialdehyde dehydrogenase